MADYLSVLVESETAFASMLEEVATAHSKDSATSNMARTLAAWTREQLAEAQRLVSRYGEKPISSKPRRLANAISPNLTPTGFGLLHDLHDCWLMANESHVCLHVLKQAALALRDEELKETLERIDHQNHRQRRWLMTKIDESAAEALVVPL